MLKANRLSRQEREIRCAIQYGSTAPVSEDPVTARQESKDPSVRPSWSSGNEQPQREVSQSRGGLALVKVLVTKRVSYTVRLRWTAQPTGAKDRDQSLSKPDVIHGHSRSESGQEHKGGAT